MEEESIATFDLPEGNLNMRVPFVAKMSHFQVGLLEVPYGHRSTSWNRDYNQRCVGQQCAYELPFLKVDEKYEKK